MTPIEYIRIDSDILQQQDLSGTDKIILGLIKSFNSKGLMLSNSELARLVQIRPDTISKVLAKLQTKELISIHNAQSRFRRIYFGENSKVCNDSTLEKNPPTLENNPITLEKTPNITKETKKTKCANGISFDGQRFTGITDDDLTRWKMAYPGIDLKAEINKAACWLVANPTRQKKNYHRFLNGWFSRCKPAETPEPLTAPCDEERAAEIFRKMAL